MGVSFKCSLTNLYVDLVLGSTRKCLHVIMIVCLFLLFVLLVVSDNNLSSDQDGATARF